MDVSFLNDLPARVIKGEITKEGAVEEILEFIQKHPQIFGLNKFDEDFKSEIMLSLLCKKERLLPLYFTNGKYVLKTDQFVGGKDLFYHIYWLVTSAINTRKRYMAKLKVRENALYMESRIQLRENELKMTRLVPAEKIPKTPFNYKQVSVEDFKKTFVGLLNSKIDKRLLVLAMKSSYYLTDEIIEKIAKRYNLNKDEFYSAIQFLNNSLDDKSQKRNNAAERRNRAFYYKLNYESQIESLQDGDNDDEFQRFELERKRELHTSQWKKLNKILRNGGPYVRPSNRMIADFLGICERQVSYYVSTAKKEIKKELNEINSQELEEAVT